MIPVAYPNPQFRIRDAAGYQQIFDPLRKQWLRLSPEEWVRQNFIQWLVQVLHYPATLIAVEKELELHGMKRRFDLLVFDPEHRPWMLVECKAESVALAPQVLEQVLRYNISIPVPFLVISNGRETMGWKKAGTELLPLTQLPQWSEVF